METFEYTHNVDIFHSKLMDRYFGDMRCVVLDIETLGLSPSAFPVILTGLMDTEPDGTCHITQYFAGSRAEEGEILLALKEKLVNYDYILTYNGKNFDLPFIEKRGELCGFDSCISECYNLDLYLLIKGHSSLRSVLPDLKQKTVETYMGLKPQREDEISGGDSVQLYREFLKTSDNQEREALKRQILLHNHDDLLQLYKLLQIIPKTDLHRAMSYLGFPAAGINGWPQLNLSSVRTDFSGLTIEGTYRGRKFSYIAYDSMGCPYSCSFDTDGSFRFQIPLQHYESSQFLDLRDFLTDWDSFRRYPAYINGFLLLNDNGRINHMESNMFSLALLKEFMVSTDIPL